MEKGGERTCRGTFVVYEFVDSDLIGGEKSRSQ